MKYYSIAEFSKLIDKSAQTLRNWESRGILIPHHKTDSGYRYYSQEQLDAYFKRDDEPIKKVVGYCRVSSNKQKDDLDRQVENMQLYLSAQGKPYEIITDIGSGINYKKKGLLSLISMILRQEVEKVVVLYKDRLVRFGFELIEYIANENGCIIEVIDYTEKTEQQELVEDMIQIITVFSCKLQGKRSRKARKMVEELLEDENNS